MKVLPSRVLLCVTHCPRNMHPYHTRCDRDTMSQRTCEDPYLYSIGFTCGWSRCDCNGDLLLDESTAKCVELQVCMQQQPSHSRSRSRKKTSKKLRLDENQEWPYVVTD
ncbi:hypothetical protein ACJJTC_013350 [Scirpophaga incertulas]